MNGENSANLNVFFSTQIVVAVKVDQYITIQEKLTDLCKLNLIKYAFGIFVFRLEQIFVISSSASKIDAGFKSVVQVRGVVKFSGFKL